MADSDDLIKTTHTHHVKFLKHLRLLLWKSYLQRMRRWQLLTIQTVLAGTLCFIAVIVAKPVFLTPLEPTPGKPLTYTDILMTLNPHTLVGYAPDVMPYKAIMSRVAEKLNKDLMTAGSEQDLNELLYVKSKGNVLDYHVIWVVWKEKERNVWKFSIRSTELANLTSPDPAQMETSALTTNRHLRVGFLSVQLAVSESILEGETKRPLRHNIILKSMPISPLMQRERVRQAMVYILLCYTLAFIPPIMEISHLVVQETTNEYKRALVMHSVSFTCVYLGWLAYLHLTSLPILVFATLATILIFRWVWIFVAFAYLAIYITITAMTAFIFCMFQRKPHIAAIWTALFTLLQLFVAELLVHHGFDSTTTFTVVLHIFVPPLGLVHGLNEFALLQTGRQGLTTGSMYESHTIILWFVMIIIYWAALMMLQRTIGGERAIGGQVSWRSIIFKKAEDSDKLHAIRSRVGNERDKLQEVDELVAKAISFNNVTKSTMGVPILKRITLDMYRGEYTQLFTDRIQERMHQMLEDLICGLSLPDRGTINILGYDMAALSKTGRAIMNIPYAVGYCHRSKFLVPELTVHETLQYFTQLSLWDQTSEEVDTYLLRNNHKLCSEYDLMDVRHMSVSVVDPYYRAQLCWAVAMILEPRIVFVPSFTEGKKYESVINDKIVKYRTQMSIVKLSFSTGLLEYADRVFLFDRKVLVFGGTPAYMFFKYGREYRVRMTFYTRGSLDNAYIEELIDRAVQMGGQVRANVGTLLILRMPTSPTHQIATFVKEITENSAKYGISSLNISLPDSEEIFKRAINDSRQQSLLLIGNDFGDHALRELSRPKQWKRVKSMCLSMVLLKQTAWKYVTFYVHYRLFLIITMLSAAVTGAIIGVYLSLELNLLGQALSIGKLIHGEKLTVESLRQRTILVLKVHNTEDAMSIATAYCMSHTNATNKEIAKMTYTALPHTESLSEYLILRAIDSPQHYVYAYAYGMSVKDENDILEIEVLYSPIHQDTAAAARSLARVYTALLRHYTDKLDADIEITDDPLVLDSSPIQSKYTVPPLIIHFMLIVTIAHITLLPSMEHGLIRHTQAHAMNSSPARYWLSLFCCDLVLYWTLVFIITTVLFLVMYWVAPMHFLHRDLIVIPFMLIMYGFSCVPQAYLFSLGPSAPLNSMTFVIFNIIFGEASVISQFVHGDVYDYAERALSLSPQYNVANAFVRLTKIFVYNSECVIFNNKKLCTSNILHKCCKKCGIMQACFERISYLSYTGILSEILWTVYHALLFSTLLVLWEYKVVQRLWRYAATSYFGDTEEREPIPEDSGAYREQSDVAAKRLHIQEDAHRSIQVDTFGEHLLVDNLKKSSNNKDQHLDGISFGIGKGEALAIVGMTKHGRLLLCDILSGFKMPTSGTAIVMSKWSLLSDPHRYSRKVGFSCFKRCPLPPWMTVYDAMWMIAVLRGIPPKYVDMEIRNLLEALELDEQCDVDVFRLHQNQRTRLNFAVAVIGAPPVLVLDEFTAYQEYSVGRAMFYILYNLRKQGHALLVSSASVESHMPVTNRLGILLRGRLEDIDHVDNLVARHSQLGYTVVVHLKDEIDVGHMFKKHFRNFTINDSSDVLVNLRIMDELNYAEMFGLMEKLLSENPTIYSYIISVIPMDYIYNNILAKEHGFTLAPETTGFWSCLQCRKRKRVDIETLKALQKFEKKYDICTLKELPWSVVFQR